MIALRKEVLIVLDLNGVLAHISEKRHPLLEHSVIPQFIEGRYVYPNIYIKEFFNYLVTITDHFAIWSSQMNHRVLTIWSYLHKTFDLPKPVKILGNDDCIFSKTNEMKKPIFIKNLNHLANLLDWDPTWIVMFDDNPEKVYPRTQCWQLQSFPYSTSNTETSNFPTLRDALTDFPFVDMPFRSNLSQPDRPDRITLTSSHATERRRMFVQRNYSGPLTKDELRSIAKCDSQKRERDPEEVRMFLIDGVEMHLSEAEVQLMTTAKRVIDPLLFELEPRSRAQLSASGEPLKRSEILADSSSKAVQTVRKARRLRPHRPRKRPHPHPHQPHRQTDGEGIENSQWESPE